MDFISLGTGMVLGVIIVLTVFTIILKKNERKSLSERPFSVTVKCNAFSHPPNHINAHRRLNGALRELVTDWMGATGAKITTSTVVELLVWAKTQAMKPDHDWPGNGDYESFIDREITKYVQDEITKGISNAVARLDADAKAASEEKNEEEAVSVEAMNEVFQKEWEKSIVKGIQNAESAERTWSNQRKAEHILNAASKRIHEVVSPLGERMAADFKETHDILKEANDQLDRIEAKGQKAPSEEPERDKIGSLASRVSGIFTINNEIIDGLKRLNQQMQERYKQLLYNHSILSRENEDLKRENAALRNTVHCPARASEVCKIPQEQTSIWRQEKANLVAEIDRLKKRECGLRNEIVMLKAFIDETTGIKVEDEGPSKPLNPKKSPEPETGPECPKDEGQPWGAPEEPQVYIGGNDPNIKVMYRSNQKDAASMFHRPIVKAGKPARGSGSINLPREASDAIQLQLLRYHVGTMTEEWRQERSELVAEIARLKNMKDIKEALAFKPQYGPAKKKTEVPLLQCAFCRKPLSLKMVTSGYQSDVVMFCNRECKELYAKSREELRHLKAAWHHIHPMQDMQVEEEDELELLSKLTAEFPEEVRLIREFKDGLVTIGEKDDPLPVEYPASNMRGIRAHLRNAKARREAKAKPQSPLAEEFMDACEPELRKALNRALDEESKKVFHAEAMRKIAETINDAGFGISAIGVSGVDPEAFKNLDENCDLVHLLKALATNGASMNAPWGTFKGDVNILATYTPERVQELRERFAKSAADKPSDEEAKAAIENLLRFKTEAGLLGLGMLTGADIIAMSPEQREAIKQRIREAKEKRKNHPSPAMGAFRVQGSNGDVIEPLIPSSEPGTMAKTTCTHSPESLVGYLYSIGNDGPELRSIHIDLARGESRTLLLVSGVFDNRKTMCRERWEDGVKVSELPCDDAMEINESFPWGSFPDFPANMMGPQPPDSEPAEACNAEEAVSVEAMNEVFQKEWEKSIVMSPAEASGPNLGGDAFDAEEAVADEPAAEEATEPADKEPCAEPVAQKARVICGFPGVGKTYYHNLHPDRVLDSDSSKFSWLSPGVRNPEFPGNYIKHIQSHLNEDVDICVSSHAAVRDALRNAGIKFMIVMPPKEDKEKFLERYRSRHNDDAFIALLNEHWEEWLGQLEECPEDTFIADSIHDLVCACAPN